MVFLQKGSRRQSRSRNSFLTFILYRFLRILSRFTTRWAILNLVWIEGKTHIPSAFKFGVDKKCLALKKHIPTAVRFGVDGICDRVTRRATPLSRCRSSYYFSLFGTSSGTPASSRDCFSNLSIARVMVCPFSSA